MSEVKPTALAAKSRTERMVEAAIHACIWIYIFVSPLLMHRPSETFEWVSYLQRLYFPLSSCAVFYLNYFWLIPRYFIEKRYRIFVLLNIIAIVLLLYSRDLYAMLLPLHEWQSIRPRRRMRMHAEGGPSAWFRSLYYLRSFISMAFIAFIAVAVKLSVRWRQAETARREAELQNIKNQINPHFLLNTLNNIYALTAFDPEKARHAIEELSGLLRYVLYENQAGEVSLKKEVDFLQTYIALMRLRLADGVVVEVEIDCPNPERVQVSPLIFISLVENAFKHGVSPTSTGHIVIRMQADDKTIRFACHNTNYPKAHDKSPGGIGLDQVRRRLDAAYSGRYEWQYGTEPDGRYYNSSITIHLK